MLGTARVWLFLLSNSAGVLSPWPALVSVSLIFNVVLDDVYKPSMYCTVCFVHVAMLFFSRLNSFAAHYLCKLGTFSCQTKSATEMWSAEYEASTNVKQVPEDIARPFAQLALPASDGIENVVPQALVPKRSLPPLSHGSLGASTGSAIATQLSVRYSLTLA